MSRVSRLNVDIAVRTGELDSGIARAKAKLNTFTADVEKMRARSQKFSNFFSGLAGGAAGMAAIILPIRLLDAHIQRMAQSAQRAGEAIEKFKATGKSLTEQGFSPVGASSLASQRDKFAARAAGGFGQAFAEQQAQSESPLDFGRSFKFWGGYLGSVSRQLVDNFGSTMLSPRESVRSAVFAGYAASASNDSESLYWSALASRHDNAAAKSYELWRRTLGPGAAR